MLDNCLVLVCLFNFFVWSVWFGNQLSVIRNNFLFVKCFEAKPMSVNLDDVSILTFAVTQRGNHPHSPVSHIWDIFCKTQWDSSHQKCFPWFEGWWVCHSYQHYLRRSPNCIMMVGLWCMFVFLCVVCVSLHNKFSLIKCLR